MENQKVDPLDLPLCAVCQCRESDQECPGCGRRVCQSCFSEYDEMCFLCVP
jgi:hypothetical protein